MKLLIGAALATALLTSAALAQTTTTAPAGPPSAPLTLGASACPALQPAPTLPDGNTATRAQMTAGDAAYQSWAHAYQASLTCRRAEIEATLAAMNQPFNAQVELLNSTTSTWTASAAAFNQKHPARQ